MKKSTTLQESADSRPPAGDNILWVWKLTREDINELEKDVFIYRTEAKAKAAMEEQISSEVAVFGEPDREDEHNVSLGGRFEWTITKVKVL